MKKSVLVPYERYLHYKRLHDNPAKKEDQSQNNTEEQNLQETVDVHPYSDDSLQQAHKLKPDIIVALLPKRNRTKAAALLSFIDTHPVLDWNSKGELLIHNQAIPFSHITDLAHDALNNTKAYDPVGCEEFYRNIGHVPLSLISNPKRRLMIGSKGPPVIPQTKSVAQNTWKDLWKSV